MERAIVLYDADCGICSWTVVKLLAWDTSKGRSPRLRALAIQSQEADEWLGDLSAKERLASWHLVDPDARRRISAGDAIAPALRHMPNGAFPAAIAGLVPSLTRRAYWWVTEHRDGFGRALGVEACRVPQPTDSTTATTTATTTTAKST